MKRRALVPAFPALRWLVASLRLHTYSMAFLQAAFTLTNLLGIYRWLLQ
jgi:hypothetical protein